VVAEMEQMLLVQLSLELRIQVVEEVVEEIMFPALVLVKVALVVKVLYS
tara:strand:+ start:623 stop:769 length:147 start_codon:yes stop_codon:yes gene_type:complete